MKPWVIAAILFPLLAGGALLWVRSERLGDEKPVPGGLSSRAEVMPGRDGRPSAATVVRGPANVAARVDAPPGDAGAPDDPGPRPVGGAVDWEAIPLDRAGGESLGDFETRQAFAQAMRKPPALSRCTEGWEAPPGIRRLDLDLELRVRSVEDALVVEDARVLEANVSDASVERCMIDELRGRRVSAPGIRPGRAFRIRWGASKTLP